LPIDQPRTKALLYLVRIEAHACHSKGQVTIPVEIRDQFGIQPNTQVRFIVRDEVVILEKAPGRGSMKRPARGEALVKRLRQRARRVTPLAMTTDELMALTRGE
jgi:AbrB family looped-hinge helix DNA binding protein